MTGDGRRTDAVWKYFGAPQRLKLASFDTFVPQNQAQRDAVCKCQSYADDLDNVRGGKGLLLYGPVGTGKTHLAVSIVRQLVSSQPEIFGVRSMNNIYDPFEPEYKGMYVSYLSVVDLLDILRPGKEKKQSLADYLWYRARTDNLVVLDDIGAEKPSEWVEERLFTLIDSRYRMERATIFTTNCKGKELEAQLGARIVDRIFEMTDQVPVTGESHRRKAL